jgi:transposase
MNAWLTLIEALEAQTRAVGAELVRLSQLTPYHEPLASLKGVSDLLAALFIAELRDPARFTRPKQIERAAGFNLYVCDSGQYKGRRRISHLGSSRLRWILYQMVSETSKYVPEVRAKYLRRRLAGHPNRQKNLVASIPQLLALVVALLRERRPYEERTEVGDQVRRLEAGLEKRQLCRGAGRTRLASA